VYLYLGRVLSCHIGRCDGLTDLVATLAFGSIMRVSHNGISRLVLYHLVLAGWAVSFDGARQQKRVTDALPKSPKAQKTKG